MTSLFGPSNSSMQATVLSFAMLAARAIARSRRFAASAPRLIDNDVMRPSSMPVRAFDPPDPDFERRVRDSFARQAMMRMLGAELIAVRAGEAEIALPFRSDLTQQHGYLHAAAITAVADSACGYAALTLMKPGLEVLSVEFKVNLLSPAAGQRFVAHGSVLKSGRTLTVCAAEVRAEGPEGDKLVAVMQATMIGASVQ